MKNWFYEQVLLRVLVVVEQVLKRDTDVVHFTVNENIFAHAVLALIRGNKVQRASSPRLFAAPHASRNQ
jgi:hypothetical protein